MQYHFFARVAYNIQISEPPLKLLIDTGSTKSFLNPEIAYKFYKNYIKYDPFIVSSVFQNYPKEYSAEIPNFQEFNSNSKLKFFLFKFHQVFDGLIGVDNLKLLRAEIDISNSKLVTLYSQIPIQYYEKKKSQFHSIKFDPHTTTRVGLPVKEKEGSIILRQQNVKREKLQETQSAARKQLTRREFCHSTDNEKPSLIKHVVPTKIKLGTNQFRSTKLFSKNVISKLIRKKHFL